MDTAVRGVIADMVQSHVVKEWAEGNFGGPLMVNGFGYILYALLGSVSTASSSGAYVHTFSLDADSNQHKSLTVATKNPNDAYRYALAMIESVEITVENGRRVTFTVNLKSKKKASATNTVSISTDYGLLAAHSTFKVAADKDSL